MTSSRLDRDPAGARIVVDQDGRRYRVVGDQFGAGPDSRIGFTGERTGRTVKPPAAAPEGEAPLSPAPSERAS